MSRGYQVPFPPNSPSPPLQKNKVVTQRQYRGKETECFNALRDVIKQLTGEELGTRYEILRKGVDANGFTLEAIDLLFKSLPEQAGPVIPLASCQMSVTEVANLANTHPGYPPQSFQPPHWPQPWQDVELGVQNAYYTSPSHGQQYYPTSNIDSAFEQGSYHDFGKNRPSNDPQF